MVKCETCGTDYKVSCHVCYPPMIDWKFKPDAEPQGNSDGFWYGINEGYIKPEVVLDNAWQINSVNEAVRDLKGFERALESAGLMEEF